MILPIHVSDSLALRAMAGAIHSSAGGLLDRLVAALLATTTHTIHRSRRGMFPGWTYLSRRPGQAKRDPGPIRRSL